MLAVRKTARGVGNIEVQDVPEPRPGPGQVVIEVNSSGICGTDLHIYLDEFETHRRVMAAAWRCWSFALEVLG